MNGYWSPWRKLLLSQFEGISYKSFFCVRVILERDTMIVGKKEILLKNVSKVEWETQKRRLGR